MRAAETPPGLFGGGGTPGTHLVPDPPPADSSAVTRTEPWFLCFTVIIIKDLQLSPCSVLFLMILLCVCVCVSHPADTVCVVQLFCSYRSCHRNFLVSTSPSKTPTTPFPQSYTAATHTHTVIFTSSLNIIFSILNNLGLCFPWSGLTGIWRVVCVCVGGV